MTRLVDRLARQGLVERRRATDDGRSQLVLLTETGAKMIDAGRAAHYAWLRRLILEPLRGLDLAALTDAFEKMGAARTRR